LEVGIDECYRYKVFSQLVVPYVRLARALTVVCDLMLQAGQLIDSALGRARDELLPQFVAVYGLRLGIPIYSHIVQT
jgi:hypothetical protein